MDISELFNHAIQKACCCEKYFKRNVDTDFFGLDLEMNIYDIAPQKWCWQQGYMDLEGYDKVLSAGACG